MKLGWYSLVLLVVIAGCGDSREWKSARELNPNPNAKTGTTDDVVLKDLGLPLYPKSENPKGMPPALRGTNSTDVWRMTADQPEAVAAFYEKLLDTPTRAKIQNGLTVSGISKEGKKVLVTIARHAGEAGTTIWLVVSKK